MKNRLSACAAAAVLLALGAAVSPAREFTDKNGRKIEAEIVAVREGKVQLKKSGDNRLFLVPVDTFSEDDQAFIKKWAVENIEYRFDVRSQDKMQKQLRLEETIVEDRQYQIEILNKTPIPIEGIVVRYNALIRKTDLHRGAPGRSKKVEYSGQAGWLNIGKLDFNQRVNVSTRLTKLFKTEKTGKVADGKDENGAIAYSSFKETHEEEYDGIWLKFYQGSKLIFEYKSESSGWDSTPWLEPDRFTVPADNEKK